MFKKIKRLLYDVYEKSNVKESNDSSIIDNKVNNSSVDDLKSAKNMKDIKINNISNFSTNYKLPSITLLDNPKHINRNDEIENNKRIIADTLKSFKVKATVIDIHIGPCYTEYVLSLNKGTKISNISSLKKEFQLYLSSEDVFIEAPIPNTTNIGINVKNKEKSIINLKELIKDIKSNNNDIILPIGQDRFGNNVYLNLSEQRNVLISGIPGSGKTNLINCFISSILMKYRPDQVKLMLIDPKKVELSNYNGVPHLMTPVVADPRKASAALQKLVVEMERRYDTFEEKGVKNITGYNELIDKENNNRPDNHQKHMHYIVAIIDELADLMVVAAKDVEDSIMRITQMARAAGIHLIVATQRPSNEIIPNVIKSNIHCRLAFMVRTQQESRIILDDAGAEKITEIGDMLYQKKGNLKSKYIHNCFISDDEIRRLIDYVCNQQKASYDESFNQPIAEDHNPISGDKEDYEDPLYDQIVEFAISAGKVSASLLQRKFRLGYNRAVRIMNLLEERGIIGSANGSKLRDVLVKMDNR